MRTNKEKTVAVGMSGGVDSAVAALLLQREGWHVLGVTLRLKPGQEADADIADAAQIAQVLGIPHHVLDLREAFQQQVVRYFINSYCSGETPNPCVVCNPTVKLQGMLDFARQAGAQMIATGHYARVTKQGERFLLQKAQSGKDQSYFLHGLQQRHLAQTLFPLQDKNKAEIRAIAAQAGLPVAQKKDSQEICFVVQENYLAFLQAAGAALPPSGDFLDAGGCVLGRHKGLAHYTVGQRKGLGAFGKPMFVTRLDAAANSVILGEAGAQYRAGCMVSDLNWIAEKPATGLQAMVKVRHRAKEEAAMLLPQTNGNVLVRFEKPVRSVTPGQFAVFYQGDTVLGGGKICAEN